MSAMLTQPARGVAATRQQLEELDALLQRMLELPVEPGQESAPVRKGAAPAVIEQTPVREVPSHTSSESCEKPAAAPAAVLSQRRPVDDPSSSHEQPVAVARVVQSQADELVKLAAGWQPSPQTWAPLAETFRQSGNSESAAAPCSVPGKVAENEQSASSVAQDRVDDDQLAPTTSRAQFEEIPAAPSAALRPAVRPETRDAALPIYLWPLFVFNVVFDSLLYLVWPIRGWLRGPTGRNLLAVGGVLGLLGAMARIALDWFGWTW